MNRTARIIILLTASLAGAAFSGSAEPQLMFHRCTVTGSTTSPLAQQRNILKNRFTTPTPADINASITLAAILEPGKDVKRWSAKSAAEIEGTVFDVKPGGIESANCGARELADRDTHIEMVPNNQEFAASRRVIVEVTPRLRAIAATRGLDWSTEALHKLQGHRIKVQGWMFLDLEYLDESENTAPGKRANWRATAWEIHPVTAITILE